jgi:hypothetical protein
VATRDRDCKVRTACHEMAPNKPLGAVVIKEKDAMLSDRADWRNKGRSA